MKISASQLRANIYKILDEVLSTGTPVEIERHGQILKIVPPAYVESKPHKKRSHKFSQLKDRKAYYKCDPDEMFENDWLRDWKP